MELRSAEQEMSDILTQYQSLRRTHIANDTGASSERWTAASLPELVSPSLAHFEEASSSLNTEQESSSEEVLLILESLRNRAMALEPKATKFRKRLGEKDPITDAPRYGEKTMSRVSGFLETYDLVLAALKTAFGEESEDGTVKHGTAAEELRRRVVWDKDRATKVRIEQEAAKKRDEERRREEEKRDLDSERRRVEELRIQQQREEQELARQAYAVRQQRLAAEQAQLEAQRRERESRERADREWMRGITKGLDGVRQQLVVLKEGASEPGAHETALSALQVLFSQIVAHPEEPNFRRVRRDHPRFNEDIGRHPGGCELLIAAGFRLGAVDDVPCFISTEPNIEIDMDGWSAWFDLLKSTVQMIDEEILKQSS